MLSTLALVVATAATIDGRPDAHASFQEYASRFGKVYVKGSDEYKQRLGLFQSRVQHIEAHNSKPNQLWTAGLNHLTDRTEEELAQLRGYRRGAQAPAAAPMMLLNAESEPALAKNVDWKNLSMTQSVVDQGGCGSCWAVATSVMLQGRCEVATGKSRTFSPQQLVNCVKSPNECGGTGGCGGATVELAMNYVRNSPSGLLDLNAEEYKGSDGKCPTNQVYTGSDFTPPTTASSLLSRNGNRQGNAAFEQFGLTQWTRLEDNHTEPLMRAVMDGPVAISLGAADWNSYISGVFNSCSKDAVVDHAVVLSGYGSNDGAKYWKIRNSWGTSWGEGGFIRLLRQDTPKVEDEYCGVDRDSGAGIACKDKNGQYSKEQPVCGMCGMLFDSVAAHFKKTE